jgi:sugar phosphate isomerase/epimerase
MAHRPNLGLCLDTFQTAAGEWGDPTTKSGRIEGASGFDVQRMYEMSLRDLAAKVPKEKIYILQVSDAYRMEQPIANTTDENGLRPRARWSNAYRPMPYDGGYLPIVPMAKAVLDTGFRGWFSLEVFDGGETGKGKQEKLDAFAQKGIGSLRLFLQEADAS